MRRLSIAVIASTFAMALAQIASAADLPHKAPAYAPPPPPPVFSWTGFYIGGNAGWVWSSGNTINNTGDPPGGDTFGGSIALGYIPAAVNLSYNGFLGGVQAGYNWQIGMWVFGLEADIDWSHAKSDTTISSPVPIRPFTSTFSRELDWLATFRGRIGITPWSAPFLLYATGGLAVGETKIGNNVVNPAAVPPVNAASETSDTRAGWTVGGGVEWAFAPQWSVKAEYLYVDLGDISTTLAQTAGFNYGAMTSTVSDHLNIVRAGLNYRF